ncbi:MAG: hypothetical protein J7M11_05770, partial [Elusimicrobia bacterium]|nr:hypothetical protein [Elusimicrobiota bacterium]
KYERDIEELNKNITEIKTESEKNLSVKERELEKVRAEIEELNRKLNGFLEEKNKLPAKFDVISEELAAMTRQRDVLFNEKNALSGELSVAKTRIEELVGDAAHNAAAIDEAAEEIGSLKEKLKNLSAERVSETVDLKNKILEQHKKMENLFSRINEYNVEIAALKAAPRESVEEYKQKLIERQEAESKMRAELDELRAEKERGAEKDGLIKDYDGKIAALSQKLSAAESEMEKMREQSAAAAEMDAQIVRKDAQLKEASGELKELRGQIESLEKSKLDANEKFDSQIRDLREKYDKSRTEIEERIKSFEKTKAELEELKTKTENLSSENISLRREKDAESAESEKLRQLASEKQKEIEKIKKLSAGAAENGARADRFENQLKEAEKQILRLKESSSSYLQQTAEFKEKLQGLGEIIEKQKKDIAEKMEYIKEKELAFHKILKKKDADISVLKAQLEIGLEALGAKGARSGAFATAAESPPVRDEALSAPSSDKRLEELQKLNDEIKRKSAEREVMLREEIERKETEAAEYKNQLKAAAEAHTRTASGAIKPEGFEEAPSELEEEIKLRAAETRRLKAEMERAQNHYKRLESIIKKQDEKISRLQNKKEPEGIVKKHDIIPDDGGDIKF